MDFDKYSKIPWVSRALSPDTPTMDNQTVKTESANLDGKEILYPTIRMIDGKLVELRSVGLDPLKYAMEKQDYISFNTPKEATNFSKYLSKMIGLSRNTNKRLKP